MINISQTERKSVPRYVKQPLVQYRQQGSLPGVYLQVSQDSHAITSCVVFMRFSLLSLHLASCNTNHALFWWKLKITVTLTNNTDTPTVIHKGAFERISPTVPMEDVLLFNWPLPLSVHGLTSRSLGIFMCSHYLLIKVVRMLYCRGKVLNIKWKLHLKYQGTSKKQVTNHF